MNEYRKLAVNQAEKLTQSYEEIWNNLSKEAVQVDKWKSSLKDASHYIKKLPCHGKYEACKSYEVQESQFKDLRTDAFKTTQKQKLNQSPLHSQLNSGDPPQINMPSTSKQSLPNEWNQTGLNMFGKTNNDCQSENTNNKFKNSRDDFKKFVRRFEKNSRTSNQMILDEVPSTANKINHIEKSESFIDDPEFKTDFKTALQEHRIQMVQKRKLPQSEINQETQPMSYGGASKKSLGGRRVTGKFVPPLLNKPEQQEQRLQMESEEEVDERLKHIDPKMIEIIKSEIMDCSVPIGFSDIAGLTYAKTIIKEAVVLPILRPDIFTGIRRPPRGILLFGPPGTGKTLLGKCIASQSKSTFFSISASSLTSKWIGDGEKMVRALFAVAAVNQPAVIFIDEIDSLLCQRSESEHESSRRLKTEFLIQLDGVGTGEDDRILIVGATNRPQELDEAARRRLVKRLYIPLPEHEARIQILMNLIKNERHSLDINDIERIGEMTEGYSGADIKNLCNEASMGPIRSIPFDCMINIDRNDVRPLNADDFVQALKRVRTSVAPNDLIQYIKWDETYGSGGMKF